MDTDISSCSKISDDASEKRKSDDASEKRKSDDVSDKRKRTPEPIVSDIKPHFLAESPVNEIKTEPAEDNGIQISDELLKEKRFQCIECEYRCSSGDKLKRHFMTHTGEKPFICSYCDYKCARSDKLKRHMMTHTGEKPFECNECDFKTARNDKLKTHIMKHIIGKIPRKTSLPSTVSQSVVNNESIKSVSPETVSDTKDISVKTSSKAKDSGSTVFKEKKSKNPDKANGKSVIFVKRNNHNDKKKAVDKRSNELGSKDLDNEFKNSIKPLPNINMPRDTNPPDFGDTRNISKESSYSSLPEDNKPYDLSNTRNEYRGSSSLSLPTDSDPHQLNSTNSIYKESSSPHRETEIKHSNYSYHNNLPPRPRIHYDQNSSMPPYHYGSPWMESSVPPNMIPVTPINSAGEVRHEMSPVMHGMPPVRHTLPPIRHGMQPFPSSHLVDSSVMPQNYHHDNRIMNTPMHHQGVAKLPPYMLGAYE